MKLSKKVVESYLKLLTSDKLMKYADRLYYKYQGLNDQFANHLSVFVDSLAFEVFDEYSTQINVEILSDELMIEEHYQAEIAIDTALTLNKESQTLVAVFAFCYERSGGISQVKLTSLELTDNQTEKILIADTNDVSEFLMQLSGTYQELIRHQSVLEQLKKLNDESIVSLKSQISTVEKKIIELTTVLESENDDDEIIDTSDVLLTVSTYEEDGVDYKVELELQDHVLSFCDGEPEDNNFGRNMSDVFRIHQLITLANDLGLKGQRLAVTFDEYSEND